MQEDTTKRDTLPEPMCPGCGVKARDMEDLDFMVAESEDDLVTPEDREDVAREDGTYNHENGHFLCNSCYIARGMPASPWGWVCP